MKKPISTLSIVRDVFDCSQKSFARFLGISRSHLAMAERRHRILSGKPHDQFYKVYMQAMQAQPVADTETIPATTSDIENYKWVLEHQMINQRKKLAAIIAKRQKALNSKALVETLRNTAGDQDEGLHLFLNVVLAGAKLKLGEANVETIALEQLKLKGMEAAWEAVRT